MKINENRFFYLFFSLLNDWFDSIFNLKTKNKIKPFIILKCNILYCSFKSSRTTS